METRSTYYRINNEIRRLDVINIDATKDPPEELLKLLATNAADNYSIENALLSAVLHPFIFTRYVRSNKL